MTDATPAHELCETCNERPAEYVVGVETITRGGLFGLCSHQEQFERVNIYYPGIKLSGRRLCSKCFAEAR